MSATFSSVTRRAAEWEAIAGSLRRAALAVARAGGPALFDELVAELASSLGVALAFVGVFDDARKRLHVRAGVLDGKRLAPFDETLSASPHAPIRRLWKRSVCRAKQPCTAT